MLRLVVGLLLTIIIAGMDMPWSAQLTTVAFVWIFVIGDDKDNHIDF